MAKGAYIGVGNSSRKLKNIYVGVGGIAKKVKRGYIGVNGVSRLFLAPSTPVYGNTLTSTYARTFINGNGACNNSNYALIGGGSNQRGGRTDYATVTSISPSLVVGSAANMSSVYNTLTASIGNYALFGSDDYNHNITSLDAYNNSLTKISGPAIHYAMSKASAYSDIYAAFGGGVSVSGGYVGTISFVNSSLSKSVSSLSSPRQSCGGVGIGNYVIFAGGLEPEGSGQDVVRTVEAFNSSLSRSMLDNMSANDYVMYTIKGNKWSMIIGTGGGYSYFYNSSLTRQRINYGNRCGPAVAALYDNMFIAGGGNSVGSPTSLISRVDESLSLTQFGRLSSPREFMSGTSVGDFILLANGDTSVNGSNIIDVIKFT